MKDPDSPIVTADAKPSTWLSLLARPLIVLSLVCIIVFILYPVAADVLAGLGIRLPRW
jgi:hypothetical protein